MARRRHRKRNPTTAIFLTGAIVAISGWWWLDTDDTQAPPLDPRVALTSTVPLTTDRPEPARAVLPDPTVTEKGATPEPGTQPDLGESVEHKVRSLIQTGKQALTEHRLIDARRYFSEALALGSHAVEDSTLLRAELTRIAGETLFSSRILEDDPWVERYIVKSGDSLAKIAKQHKVSDDLLAAINHLRNKNMIRVGQSLKIIRGPFHAKIDRAAFRLDVFLGSTLVKHYKVGLGEDGSTPSGEWRVNTKLANPTYYPPRGGNIIGADDPTNPLGERWIGLEGIAGEAKGQQRYGIHGTIEPDSIGKNDSLGCVRMYNEDVEQLYTYLVEKHSTVTVY